MGELPLQKNKILIVDDDAGNLNKLVRLLRRDYTLYVAKDGYKAVEVANRHLPDLILLDIIMPEMDGYEVVAALRAHDDTKNIPIIFITGLDSEEDEELGLALEVADYISKPFRDGIVRLRVENQIKMVNIMRTIEKMSYIDALTGLPNRRSFNTQLSREWNRAIRETTPLSLAVMDIDFFKRYNDTYGHPQGDVLLQTVGRVFTQSLRRSTDFVARWGGEEFTVLMPLTDSEGALDMAERMRVNVAATEVLLENGTATQVTISLGVNTIIPTPNCDVSDLIEGADKALYTAKREGRNRTIVTDHTKPTDETENKLENILIDI